MDAGIATDANVAWLVEHGYRYLVVRRGGLRQFDENRSVTIETAGEELLHLQKELSPDGRELCLYCHSPTRQLKEEAMLAYQCVQFLRVKLKNAGITDSWATLRDILSLQRRVTATFSQRDGRSLHVRKATDAEPDLLAIYRALGISSAPGGTRKLIS